MRAEWTRLNTQLKLQMCCGPSQLPLGWSFFGAFQVSTSDSALVYSAQLLGSTGRLGASQPSWRFARPGGTPITSWNVYASDDGITYPSSATACAPGKILCLSCLALCPGHLGRSLHLVLAGLHQLRRCQPRLSVPRLTRLTRLTRL